MSEGQTTPPAPAADIDERIRTAAERARRYERLRHQRGEVEQLMGQVRERLGHAERAFAKEHHDVVNLERNAFKLNQGKLMQLDRERWEAARAHEVVTGERSRLNQLHGDAQKMDAELAELQHAPREHEEALKEKERQLEASGDPRARELAEVNRELAGAENALREHVEALNAGREAMQPLAAVQQQLGGATTWGTVDIFTGIGTIGKHMHLQNADQLAWHAQRGLDVLARELSDLGIHNAPQLPKIDTKWVADVLFDNLIYDAIRQSEIKKTAAQIDQIGHWLAQTIQWLDGRCVEIDRDVNNFKNRRAQLIGA